MSTSSKVTRPGGDKPTPVEVQNVGKPGTIFIFAGVYRSIASVYQSIIPTLMMSTVQYSTKHISYTLFFFGIVQTSPETLPNPSITINTLHVPDCRQPQFHGSRRMEIHPGTRQPGLNRWITVSCDGAFNVSDPIVLVPVLLDVSGFRMR